jgi:hypothetical protein
MGQAANCSAICVATASGLLIAVARVVQLLTFT